MEFPEPLAELSVQDVARLHSLAQNEEAFSALLHSIPAMVWLGDEHGRITYFSDQFYKFTGTRREDDDGFLYMKVIHPDDLAKRPIAMEAIKARKDFEIEVRHRAQDGSYRWFIVRGKPFVGSDGNLSYVGTNMDIDDRKRAEEALKQSEEEFRRLAELIPQFVAVSDGQDGRTLYANQRFYDYIGKSRCEETGYLWMEVTHPDDLKAILPQVGGPPQALWEMEVRYRAADGTYRWHLVRSVAGDAQGSKVFTTATDIDDKKNAEEEVRESEARLRTLAEAIPQIVWCLDEHGTLVFVNQRYFEFTGLSLEQGLEGGWKLLIHPDDLPSYIAELEHSLETGETFEQKFRVRRAVGIPPAKSKEFRLHLGRAVALRGASGNIIQWFGTWTDIE